MNKAICAVLAITFVSLVFYSCASDPAVPETPPETSPAFSEEKLPESVETDTSATDEPVTTVLSVEPLEPETDYIYPEPGFMAITDEQSMEMESEKDPAPMDTAPEPEPAPAIDPVPVPPVLSEPEAVPEPVAEAITEPEPAPRTATAPDQKPAQISVDEEPVTPPVAEEITPKEIPEIWTEDSRVSEPPPPVERAPVIPSRSVTVPRDGTLEVWYPGTGWVYLGDASGLVGVAYETRKIENRDTLFTFRARRTGSYLLEFSRYDVLTDDFIQDALAVTVVDPVPGKRTTVRAEDFSLGGIREEPEQPAKPEVSSLYVQDEPMLSSPLTAPDEESLTDPEKSPDEYLEIVQNQLASGDAPGALATLDLFFMAARTRMDEGWYLRGQAYEANSSSRNIRKALEAYETVVSAFPDSSRWKDASERVRYIRQFYFRIR